MSRECPALPDSPAALAANLLPPPDGKPLPAEAELAFAAVDQALLELRPNESWNLLDAMLQGFQPPRKPPRKPR